MLSTSAMSPRISSIVKKYPARGSMINVRGTPAIAIKTLNTEKIMYMIKQEGQHLAKRERALMFKCARHHLSGLSILVAIAQANNPWANGGEPPPKRRSRISRTSRIHAPYFFWMNTIDIHHEQVGWIRRGRLRSIRCQWQ